MWPRSSVPWPLRCALPPYQHCLVAITEHSFFKFGEAWEAPRGTIRDETETVVPTARVHSLKRRETHTHKCPQARSQPGASPLPSPVFFCSWSRSRNTLSGRQRTSERPSRKAEPPPRGPGGTEHEKPVRTITQHQSELSPGPQSGFPQGPAFPQPQPPPAPATPRLQSTPFWLTHGPVPDPVALGEGTRGARGAPSCPRRSWGQPLPQAPPGAPHEVRPRHRVSREWGAWVRRHA